MSASDLTIQFNWAGTDEVGRGCLAGPVVAAAVAWTDGPVSWAGELRDSKKLSPERRTNLAQRLVGDAAVRWAIAWRDVTAIDRCNILQASLQAMVEAVTKIGSGVSGVYVDGNQRLPIAMTQQTVVGGDDAVPQIAAASIIAKVFRDRWMACLDGQFPGYGWAQNKGYGTKDHMAAIEHLGPSPQHRQSFGPVRQMSLFS